jgi:hypothetical protein
VGPKREPLDRLLVGALLWHAESIALSHSSSRRTLLRSSLVALAAAMARCSPVRSLMDSGREARESDARALPDADAAPDVLADAAPDVLADADASLDARDSAGLFPLRTLPPRPPLRSLIASVGALQPADANGVRLPPGFRSRVIARTGAAVERSTYAWHIYPDGGATFVTEDGGWIYVSNSEVLGDVGGVGAIRFDRDGTIVGAHRILDGTNFNCAGGPTPWSTWLSCEEIERGLVWECDPWGESPAIARPALGVFRHEAVAVDHDRQHLYLTEDEWNGRLYRFVPDARTPAGYADLRSGTLEAATVDALGNVRWDPVPDPRFTGALPTREQLPDSTAFNGAEGVWYHAGVVYFSTKGDDRVWAYDVARARLTVIYTASEHAEPDALRGVDNVIVTCCGDVLVAEDGGSMQVVAILPDGSSRPLLQVVDEPTSEITGPALDPSGTRLYFSSQRGPTGGTTYEITGPFSAPL